MEAPTMRPPRVRLTVRRLMALILSLAIGGAILRQAAVGWDAGEARVLAACALAISLTPVLWPAGRGRSFPLGFALGGWAYLVLSLGPGIEVPEASYLPTSPLLGFMFDRIYPDSYIRKEAYGRSYCG